ncbi:mitochondrial inner membrane protease subunit 1 isoform X2 [Haemorhous mexicanus]|uniref:mitochondrial inner membrane protease subunit 1 isoform X2 n=1 Tax=Haemorhous mexicanus TaxID=30427 RepID=UPI0028BE5ADC|nr:mitochondrial inner membrane protease subunit 1 isoform X2 [Haemorhous mexicanus]
MSGPGTSGRRSANGGAAPGAAGQWEPALLARAEPGGGGGLRGPAANGESCWAPFHCRMLRNALGKTFRFLGYTVQYGCIAHCAFEYLGGIVVCSGPSMEPTIQNSDVVFSENLSRHFYCIRKGDIVIVKSPNDPKSNICKRVIGLEGDKVCTSNPSDFLKSHSYVPKGHVWLEGDNLRNSTDSRCYGPVPYGLIRGRICLKIWPLNDFGFLRASPNGHRFLDD